MLNTLHDKCNNNIPIRKSKYQYFQKFQKIEENKRSNSSGNCKRNWGTKSQGSNGAETLPTIP